MPGHGADDRWLEAAFDAAESAAEDACRAIAEHSQVLLSAGSYARSGYPTTLVVRRLMADGLRERRVAAGAAMQRYETATLELRAALIRHLVDHDRVSLAEAGRMFGVSRQRAGRIYSDHRPCEPADAK